MKELTMNQKSRTQKKLTLLAGIISMLFCLNIYGDDNKSDQGDLFEPIRSVLQHPRCQNFHIPGDQPLQYDEGKPHGQNVMRGLDGKGMTGMRCSSCHQDHNSPTTMGDNAPPGAPHWQLPPEHNKMVFINLTPHDLCLVIKDPKKNGGRDGKALIEHFAKDKLVAWGWAPGGKRILPPLTKAQTVAAVKEWVSAGMPCPEQ
jgi:hypothetical protein